MNSPIPAEHISNTNPLALAPGEALGSSAEGELLELQAKLAFHGRRLFRHEVRGLYCTVLHCIAVHLKTDCAVLMYLHQAWTCGGMVPLVQPQMGLSF